MKKLDYKLMNSILLSALSSFLVQCSSLALLPTSGILSFLFLL